MQRLFDFYINSSIHVALAVVAFTQITYVYFNIVTDFNILIFVGFATISGYNFVKYFGLAKFHHRSLANWLKIIQVFSLICTVAMVYFALQLELRTLIYLSCFGVITFLYAIPLVPKHYVFDENKNLRQIGGLKIYVIALVWASITVGLPVYNAELDFNWDVVITCIQRFLLVVVLTLPFEIRDLKYDSLKLSTIPQTIGIKNTKGIGALVLILIFNLEFLKDELVSNTVLTHLIMILLILILLMGSRKNQAKYYSSFIVESVPIVWLVLLILFY
ncbi:hypothetical protein [Winogradskyella sp. A3E31]|uniref:hypothetical protein n=1 Tax=Winogradskyella sp. A3E31 TaxID=3349637 RepID=UPI00398AA093